MTPATPETVAAAVEQYRAGVGRDELQKRFHIGYARLMREVRAAGIETHRAGRPRKPKQTQQQPQRARHRVVTKKVELGSLSAMRTSEKFINAAVPRCLFRIVRVADGELLGGANDASAADRLRNVLGAGAAIIGSDGNVVTAGAAP